MVALVACLVTLKKGNKSAKQPHESRADHIEKGRGIAIITLRIYDVCDGYQMQEAFRQNPGFRGIGEHVLNMAFRRIGGGSCARRLPAGGHAVVSAA
jgi:hypothetical protein